MTNEQLCSLVREGDKAAEAALIENVLPSIRITAVNIQKRYPGILLETDDLVQEALAEMCICDSGFRQHSQS